MSKYMLQSLCLLAGIAMLSACDSGSQKTDYDASARCQSMGYQPGTAEYDRCVEDEKLNRMMQQQRQDYERMKQQEMDQKLWRY